MIISVLSSLKAQADELREIRRVFNQIDMNHDGSLTIDELRECLKDVNLYELFTDDKLESNEDDNEAW
jgi:Ca2+-binding EF-hand superfamily protein